MSNHSEQADTTDDSDADRDAPPMYRQTVDETSNPYHSDPSLFYCKLVEIITDGDDYLFGREWSEMSSDDRNEYVEWLWDLHTARVACAEAQPEVRALVAAMMDAGEIDDEAASTRGALQRAREVFDRDDYDDIVQTVLGRREHHDEFDEGPDPLEILVEADRRDEVESDDLPPTDGDVRAIG